MTAWRCARCGASSPPASERCAACGEVKPAAPGPTVPPEATPAAGAGAGAAPGSAELLGRLERLGQWSEAALGLGVALPALPSWVTEAVRRTGADPAWGATLDRIERDVRQRIAPAFDQARERLSRRLLRLEAYAIDTRLERTQLEEMARTWRSGDLAGALWTFPQLERVVAVKERHLDQARDDLLTLLGFVRDLEAIGVATGAGAGALAAELEPELRAGRLSSLRQRLRSDRQAAVEAFRAAVPRLVTQLGGRLAAEQERGLATDADVRDLAAGAREALEGQPEDGARMLRRVAAPRGLRATHPVSAAADPG